MQLSEIPGDPYRKLINLRLYISPINTPLPSLVTYKYIDTAAMIYNSPSTISCIL